MRLISAHIILAAFLLLNQIGPAQTIWSDSNDGIGLPFMKIGVGPRQAGLGQTFAGVGDDIYTLYYNPGGLGHLRRWQWSVNYNRWFTDVYQAGISFGKQFRILGSHKTAIGLSCTYLGMPEWDATNGLQAPVNANHLVAGLTIGQRLDWIHPTLSIGFTGKALQSHLADYAVNGYAADAGIMYKSPQFRVGSGKTWGIVSAGVAVNHYGLKLIFDEGATYWPRTYRAGASILMGSYNKFSVLIAGDWSQVQVRDTQYSIGTELWWLNMLGARAGYRWNQKDLGDFSFGFGFRWGDVINSLMELPTRFGDAFSFDLAGTAYGDVLQQTYRGAVSHYPLAPEPFRLEPPTEIVRESRQTEFVELSWEEAFDPDPFDEVGYLLVVDRDREKVQRSVQSMEYNLTEFYRSELPENVMIFEQLEDTSYVMPAKPGDVFYWAVAAYDLGNHARLAKQGKESIGQIIVPTADLLVKRCDFDYSPWITMTPEQGEITVTIANGGNKPALGFYCEVLDRFMPRGALWAVQDTLKRFFVTSLEDGSDTTVVVQWETPLAGPHEITVIVDADSQVNEFQKFNNVHEKIFMSIPKGVVTVPDTVEVVTTDYDSTQIPVVPEIYFAPESNDIDTSYYMPKNGLPPILMVLAQRLKSHPETKLDIYGYIDVATDSESPRIADQRALTAHDKLVEMGVPAAQLHIAENYNKDIKLRFIRKDPIDDKRVKEQNRSVVFRSDTLDEEKLFQPISVAVDTSVKDRILFALNLNSPAQYDAWVLKDNLITLANALDRAQDSLVQMVSWDGTDNSDRLVMRNQWYPYQLVVIDTMGRQFKTYPDSTYLQERKTVRRQEVFGASKFASVEPVYAFYWERMLSLVDEMATDANLTLQFEGHACEIGPISVNQNLSARRANAFTQAFLERVRGRYPDQYSDIVRRIEQPMGYGESQPLYVKLRGYGNVMLGDNDSPVGRYLNRRISILLLRKR